jgi:hypothetical protein
MRHRMNVYLPPEILESMLVRTIAILAKLRTAKHALDPRLVIQNDASRQRLGAGQLLLHYGKKFYIPGPEPC